MTEWVSRPELPKQAKINVKKLRFPDGDSWAVIIPSIPVDGEKRFHFVRYENWWEAHTAAFTIYDHQN